MPDDQNVALKDTNAERIRKWQEDRKRLAEQQKDTAAVESKDRSVQAVIANQIPKTSSAAHLLPTEGELMATKTRLRKLQRRSKSIAAFQFLVTCLIPWIGAAYYLTVIATPLYEARSVISVSSPSSVTETNQNGILGSLGGPSNMQDVFMAHAYIQSLAMMEELESEGSIISELSGPMLDPIQRLRDVSSLSLDKHRQFTRFVDSAVDIQTGLITLYVRLPEQSQAIDVSEAVLAKVSDQVSKLNTGVIAQRLSLANDAASQAQDKVAQAHADLLKVQIDSGEADPAERIASLYAQISLLETEVTALNKEIQKADVAGQQDSFQVQRVTELRNRLTTEIAAQRAILVSDNQDGSLSLNALMMQHQRAALRVSIAEEELTTALTAQANATHEAALARSLFQVVVPPRTSTLAVRPNIPAVMSTTIVLTLALFAMVRVIFGRRDAI